MKYVLSFLAVLVTLGFTLPTPPKAKYKYTIGLSGVDNIVSAKEATEYIRYKFDQFPVFNDTTDVFIFESDVLVTDSSFRSISTQNGYTVNKFERAQ